MTDFTSEDLQVLQQMKETLAAKKAAKLSEDKDMLVMGTVVTDQSGLGAVMLREFVTFYGPSTALGAAGDAMLKAILRWNTEMTKLAGDIKLRETGIDPNQTEKPQPEEPTSVVHVTPEKGI